MSMHVGSGILLALLVCLLPASLTAASDPLSIEVTWVSRSEEPHIPLSLLDPVLEDNGRPGAELGLLDNQTTGSFLNQTYIINDLVVEPDEDLLSAFTERVNAGQRLFITDLDAVDLLAIADIAEDSLLFNIRARDDTLRNEECRHNVLHIPPSRAMEADALAQYLAWKRWTRLVLVTGRHPQDKAYADALRRAAKRFGLKIVEDKDWTSVPGARRTDSGHHSAQQEIPTFTQFKDHDVLLVADEKDEFGEYLSYRTTRPRPVAGTQGLLPTPWHRSQEQWGATQIQRRFEALANRVMTERDYSAWAAMRSIGEAVTNTGDPSADAVKSYLLSEQFKLAGFKGVPLTFRNWNGQLRQPILVVAPRMLVTVSPQDGFLHERSILDTLGYDQPESLCKDF